MALRATRKSILGCCFDAGLTASRSAALDRLLAALDRYHMLATQGRLALVRDAYVAWATTAGVGEVSLLSGRPEFRELHEDLGRPSLKAAAPARAATAPGSFASTTIVASLLSVPNNREHFRRSTTERLKLLDDALDACHQQIVAQGSAVDQAIAFRGILVAPEYYFSAQSSTDERIPLTDAERVQIEQALLGLSRKYPRIVLVPGTIHYTVPLGSKADAGYMLLTAAKQRIERERAAARAAGRLASFSPGAVLSKVMSHRATGDFSQVPSMNALATTLLDKGSAPAAVHNCTYLLLAGQRHGRYDKQTDFYEAKSASPDVMLFAPGTSEHCPVIGDAFGRFRFGIEICFDHANGVLKHRNPADLHFHIVVSDYVDPVEAHMAMAPGGCFLHASTNYAVQSATYRLDDGSLLDARGSWLLRTQSSGLSKLDHFAIYLPSRTA